MVTILASIAQQESASISQNVRMGINFGFQEGHGRVNLSTFLGYKSAGKPGTYEIVPAEADVVRRIYRQYLEGYSPKMIAEVQIRLLLELVDEMVKNSLPEWMAGETQVEGEETGACRDYDDFFKRTRYKVPEGVLTEDGRMESFNNDLVIRYLDRVVVKDDGYEVVFKAGVTVEVEI